MTARAIASSTLSFGLLSIPVKLYASRDSTKELSFHLIHKGCGSRLKQRLECEKEGVLVSGDEVVKGYEVAKDEHVTFSKEELAELEQDGSDAIEMLEFVPADQVDLRFVENTYYIAPDKGGAKGYELLRLALMRAGRAAIGKYSLRGKERIVAIQEIDGRLVVDVLPWPGEIRAASEIPIERPSAPPALAELELAVKLVDAGAGELEPEKYKDETRARIYDAVDKKVKGQEIKRASKEAPKAVVIDLMEALKASLLKANGARANRPATSPAPKKAKARRPSSPKKRARAR